VPVIKSEITKSIHGRSVKKLVKYARAANPETPAGFQCQFTNVNKFLKSLATTLALAKEVTMD